jgi:hypothetical protein
METNLVAHETGRPARRRFTAQQIADYLKAQPPSGLTIAAFCKELGLPTSVFYRWKRRAGEDEKASPAFREVTLPTPVSSAWVGEIALPAGAVLRFSAQANLTGLQSLLSQLLRL